MDEDVVTVANGVHALATLMEPLKFQTAAVEIPQVTTRRRHEPWDVVELNSSIMVLQ
jgi:hypothetical protein